MTRTDEQIRIHAAATPKRHREDTHIEYAEDFDEETSIFRKLCLLPFEPIWYHFIIILAVIDCVVAMINCIRAILGDSDLVASNIFYFFDMIWFLNTSILVLDKYIRNLKTTQVLFPRRYLIWYAIDYASIFPIELCFSVELLPYLSLRKSLKIIYIMFVFRFLNKMLDSKVVGRIFQLNCNVLYVITLVSLVFAVIVQKFDGNARRYGADNIVYVVADHMTGRGFGHLAREHYLNKLLVITSSLALFVGVLLICTANVTFLFYTASLEKNIFRYKISSLRSQLHHGRYGREFIDCMDVVFDVLWTDAHGSEAAIGGKRPRDERAAPSILSQTFLAEITVDMCTGIFKHSMLLKGMPVPFLRDLSAHVTYEVYMPQQLICKLDELKDKMIYIYMGIVDIISDEDGESPMVRLTAGTCLSEVCLFVPYKSNFLVRCATTCVFHILRRRDLLGMVKRYPVEHALLRGEIERRIREGRVLKGIQDVVNRRADARAKCTNLCWLLHVLHEMAANAYPHSARLHQLANKQLARAMSAERFKNHIFSPMHLTLYAVPEERQDYNDTLFAKSTFPYVFKPNTGLTLFWEVVISVMALAAGLAIPFLAFVADNESANTLMIVVHFFDGVWLMDIVFQLRISIVYEKKVVSGFLDILIMKLTSVVFLFDIASVLPLEIFVGIWAYESNRNYVYMNRILKLVRVIRLMVHWESHYNSNPLQVRFVCALLFIVYSVFILSCVYYNIAHRGDGGPEQFEILLFYTSQMLTGVSVWVDGYSDFRAYELVNIVLYMVIGTIYSVMHGIIFSAYASLQFNMLHIKHNNKALIRAAASVDPRYEAYVTDVLLDLVTTDNGFSMQSPDYLFQTVPQDFLVYLYEDMFETHILRSPVFAGIPQLVLRQIFEEGGVVRRYNAHEVIFHVGELVEDLLLLITGTCEVICGVGLCASLVLPVYELNSLEVRLALPMRTAVITLTHCRVLHIKYAVMRRVLVQRGSHLAIRSQLSGLRDMRARIQHARTQYFTPDVMDKHKMELATKSHVYFGRTNPIYLAAYKQTGLYKLRWLFMNLTFCPGGRFIEMWEITRCVCAVLSALFFTSITPCFYLVPHPLGVLKWALEVMAMVDIYIRMHCAYYNAYGILVTHPAKTIVYYFKHGFLIDAIAVLPLHLAITRAEHVILNANKLLQMHRFITFISNRKNHRVVPPSKGYMFVNLPLMLVIINVMASLMLLVNCTIDMSDITHTSITCARDSIFDYKDYPLTNPSVAHIHAIYIILSITSKIAIQGFTVRRSNMLYVGFMSILGYCLEVANSSRIFGFFIHDYMDTMRTYLRMRLLKEFISSGKKNKNRTSSALIREAENHIRLVWSMAGSNLYYHSKFLPFNLRRDIIYKKFGPTLVASCLKGSWDVQGLVRNLLVKAEYRILQKHAFVQLENDICEHTIIIFSGLVYLETSGQIEDSEGTKVGGVTLGPGSIIGNLCPLQYNRLKATMHAVGVLEMLYIKTNTFFEIMQHFPSSQDVFQELRYLHITHVPGNSDYSYPKVAKSGGFWKISKRTWLAFLLWNLLNFVGAYLSQIIYFYHIITVTIYGKVYYLIGDGCLFIAILMTFVLPITNEKGDLMSKRDIVKIYYRSWLFYVTLVSCIPIYIFIPTSWDRMLTFYITVAARSNILLRNFFFFKTVNYSIERTPSLMFILTFALNVSIILLFIMGTTAVIILISDVQEVNMRPMIRLQALLNASPEVKNEHMVTYLYVVTNMFTHTSQPVYSPVGLFYIILFIIMMSIVMVFNTVIFAMVVSVLLAIQQLKLGFIACRKEIQTLMKRSDTSSILNDRLDFYCKMTWKTRKGYKIPKLFLQLPTHLREAMAEDLFGGILEHHDIFAQVHNDLRRQLYNKLRLDYFYHGDYIVYKGTCNETMFFVHKGTVVSLEEDSVLAVGLEAGESFALMQGIMENLPHDLTYRAACDSVILSLVKKDWDYMLHFFPASRNIISAIVAKTVYATKPHND